MPKTDLLQAMAEAFKKGGIQAAYNFPGFNSHKLFDYLEGGTTSTNEKVAYELAWGSSQAGRPSLVTFKNVGLNDAADPFINSMLTGVGSGLVLVVFDDIELEGSQCILDSRHYFGFYGGLWLEPFDFASAEILAEAAPQLSRIFDLPIVIRLTNYAVRFENDSAPVPEVERITKLAEAALKECPVEKVEPLVHPINGDAHRKLITAKNKAVQQFVNELHELINPDGLKGRIYSGYNNESADAHIVTLPGPTNGVEKVKAIYEVGDPVIAEQLTLQSAPAKIISHTAGYNPENAKQYIVTSRYERLMRLLKPRYDYITGDLGEYTKDTLHTLTHCLCFGSAISVAVGMGEAGKKALAITGDASFYHSGKNAIAEAELRQIPVKVVLLDNGGSQGTGGQRIPGVMPNNFEVVEIEFDAIEEDELEKVVDSFMANPKSTILKVNHEV